MVIADAATGTIATSQPAPAGDRPRALGFVNAPVQWGGITWSAYDWQMIPKDDQGERGRLFMHELFHCIQPRLGLITGGSAGENSHLDSLEGRYWMRLEWRALARALGASGAARTSAIADALAFRAARHQRFPGAAAAEHAVDINEGIATYTQYVTGSDSSEDASRRARATLSGSETGTSFVRTFAYASGAGYGLLLDALSPGWHRKIGAVLPKPVAYRRWIYRWIRGVVFERIEVSPAPLDRLARTQHHVHGGGGLSAALALDLAFIKVHRAHPLAI